MSNRTLEMYRQMMTSLKRGYANGSFSNAKPIMLITLLEFVPLCKSNIFCLSDKILKDMYKTNSKILCKEKLPHFIVPYFHMDGEPFYSLIWSSDERPPKYPSTPSEKTLSSLSIGAKLDDELWELLQDEGNRAYLKNCIIEHYLKTV